MYQVSGIEIAGHLGHTAGQIGVANQRYAMMVGYFARLCQLAVAAAFRRQIDNYTAGFHGFHHIGGDQLGSGLAGNQGGGDDDIHLFGLFREQRHLRLDELVAHLLGIAAAATTVLVVEIQHQELGAHAFNLFFHFQTGIKRPHNGAHAVCGADRSEASDAGPDHHDLCWRHLASRRHLTGKEPPEVIGRLNHRAVAGNIGHGAQGIHLLGTTDAGQAINGEGGNLFGRQLLQQFGILRWPQVADQERPFLHQVHFVFLERRVLHRRADLEDKIRVLPKRFGVRRNGSAHFFVGVVRVIRGLTRTGFDHHLIAKAYQLMHRGRRCRYPSFILENLPGDTDLHCKYVLRNDRFTENLGFYL